MITGAFIQFPCEVEPDTDSLIVQLGDGDAGIMLETIENGVATRFQLSNADARALANALLEHLDG